MIYAYIVGAVAAAAIIYNFVAWLNERALALEQEECDAICKAVKEAAPREEVCAPKKVKKGSKKSK